MLNDGIFISDSARDQMNINLSEDQFKALKDHINKMDDPNEKKKCFITNTYYPLKDGLFLDKKWVADSLQQTIDSQDKLYMQFKNDKLVVCSKCGKASKYHTLDHFCPHCNHVMNLKKYEKQIKLPYVKRMAFRLLIKSLGGK
jgi:ribosomal protein L37E